MSSSFLLFRFEFIVLLGHEVEVILGHDPRILHPVEIIQDEVRLVSIEPIGVEGHGIDLGLKALTFVLIGHWVDLFEPI